MIFDAILGFICAIPNMTLDAMTSIESLVIPEGTFDWWYNIFNTISYVFPVHTLIPIFTISFTLKGTQILWALFNKIKGIFWASS